MDYNQSNCKNYFSFNTNNFYYEPQLNESSLGNDRSKGFQNDSLDNSFNSTFNSLDYSFKQPFCDSSTVDLIYQSNHSIDDNQLSDDLHLLNRHQLSNHTNFLTNNSTYHQLNSNYLPDHQQNEFTNSLFFHSSNQSNQNTTAHQQFTTDSSTNLQSTTIQSPLQIQQHASAQQTKQQLSVNLSMNMTMDIKSMDFKTLNSVQANANQSDYNHVVNGVVSNVANKLVTNFNSNLLSPTNQSNQKEYQLYQQNYQSNQSTKPQYSFYGCQNNSNNYYNQRYHNTTFYPNDQTTNHLINNPYTNNSFDELAQFKHFNNHHNDCHELSVYNPPNWPENNTPLTSLTSASLTSNLNSLNSLGSSFSNDSFSSNEINNNNDQLINYSNNFLNSIGNKSIDTTNSIDPDTYHKGKMRLPQMHHFQSYSTNCENDNQKVYFKIESGQMIKTTKDRQDTVLRVRSNENRLERREIDFCQINGRNRLEKRMKALYINGNKNTNLCKLCGKFYARPSTLKTHLRTHSDDRPYKCHTCSKSFSQAANLAAHARTHTGEKPFSCKICNRHFSQSSSVTTHIRTHSGERPYGCDKCDKKFADSSTLTKHLRIHTGEKPYQCHLCQLKFSQSGNLNRHMRVHNFNQ